MSDRIGIEALRKALADNEQYTNPWTDFCPGPEEVLALVRVVVAAERVLPFLEPRHQGYLAPVLDRFDFGGETDASE